MDECEDCEAFVEEKEDEILEMAVYYILKGRYESNLSKDKKQTVRKRARSLSVEDGEVFMRRKKRNVRVSSVLPVMLILLNHHYLYVTERYTVKNSKLEHASQNTKVFYCYVYA